MAFFNSSYEQINKAITGFMHTTSDGLITGLAPLLITAITIYFMCKAWSIMYGTSQDSLRQVTMQCIKMTFISALFCSTAYFYTTIAEPFYKLDETFIPIISKSFDDPPENCFDAIDKLYDTLMSRAGSKISVAFEAANSYTVPLDLGVTTIQVHTLASYLNAFIYATCVGIMMLSTIFAAFAAFVLLITNTLGLCFILAFGPLFGAFLLFPQTKDFFNAWLKQCMVFVLTKVFVTAALMLMLQVITTALGLGGSEGSISTSRALTGANADKLIKGYVIGPLSEAIAQGLKLILISLLIAVFAHFIKIIPGLAQAIVGSGLSMGGGGAVNAATTAGGAAAKAATAGTAGAVSGAVGKGVGKLAQTAQNHGMNRTAHVMNAIGSKLSAKPTPSKN